MKNKKYHFLITILCFILNVWVCVSQPPPPGEDVPDGPPPPPLGMPIDDNIWVLGVMGFLLGAYIIHKFHIHKKTPM